VLDRTLICPLLGSGRQIRVPSLHKHSASFHYVASQASPQASGGGKGAKGSVKGGGAFGVAIIWNYELWPVGLLWGELAFALQNGFGGNVHCVIDDNDFIGMAANRMD